jgi:hypothetical protein
MTVVWLEKFIKPFRLELLPHIAALGLCVVGCVSRYSSCARVLVPSRWESGQFDICAGRY